MNHKDLDRASLEMAEAIADRLRTNPGLIEIARENLARWSSRNAESPSLLRAYEEWRGLLDLPLERVCQLLTADTDEGQRLRQNSPFPGILTPQEVWAIKEKYRTRETQRP